jgi:cytochrome oxidase Cu insertion factor (SCO1/SenC/PrrC family)
MIPPSMPFVHTMRTILAAMLISLLLPLSGQAQFWNLPAARYEAPDFTLADLGSNQVSLSDYRGRAVILLFWATW